MDKKDISNRQSIKVKHRDEKYSEKLKTKIWAETPTKNNPYVTESASCYGYDQFDLVNNAGFVDTLFLIIKGEFPNAKQKKLFEKTLVAFINPGPRNNAVRAATTAAASRTFKSHILPIGLAIYSGEYQGAGGIENAIKFIRKHKTQFLHDVLLDDARSKQGWSTVFGKHYGQGDPFVSNVLKALLDCPGDWECLTWLNSIACELEEKNCGVYVMREGVFAAVLCDLGILPTFGASLYQLAAAPGIVAHGLEYANKPATALPFVSDDNYEIQ